MAGNGDSRHGNTEHQDALNGRRGRELFDATGAKIGTVLGLGYPRPKFGTLWLAVETAGAGPATAAATGGEAGGTEAAATMAAAARAVLVPAAQVQESGERLTLPYPKTYVAAGPAVEPGGRLSRQEERRLCLHYGFEDELPGGGCRQAAVYAGAGGGGPAPERAAERPVDRVSIPRSAPAAREPARAVAPRWGRKTSSGRGSPDSAPPCDPPASTDWRLASRSWQSGTGRWCCRCRIARSDRCRPPRRSLSGAPIVPELVA